MVRDLLQTNHTEQFNAIYVELSEREVNTPPNPTVALHSLTTLHPAISLDIKLWQCCPYSMTTPASSLTDILTSAIQPFSRIHWYHPNTGYFSISLLYIEDRTNHSTRINLRDIWTVLRIRCAVLYLTNLSMQYTMFTFLGLCKFIVTITPEDN